MTLIGQAKIRFDRLEMEQIIRKEAYDRANRKIMLSYTVILVVLRRILYEAILNSQTIEILRSHSVDTGLLLELAQRISDSILFYVENTGNSIKIRVEHSFDNLPESVKYHPEIQRQLTENSDFVDQVINNAELTINKAVVDVIS